MTRDETARVLAWIQERYPKSDWDSPSRDELIRRIARFPISAEQAIAALVNDALAKHFKACMPADILKALTPLVSVKPDTGADDLASDRKLVLAALYERREEMLPLLIELHAAEPRTPRHYMDAWSCYAAWPVSCQWLAARLRSGLHNPK